MRSKYLLVCFLSGCLVSSLIYNVTTFPSIDTCRKTLSFAICSGTGTWSCLAGILDSPIHVSKSKFCQHLQE